MLGPGPQPETKVGAHLRLVLLVCLAAALPGFLSAAPAGAAFGFRSVELSFADEQGAPAVQAGSHPDSWTIAFAFNTTTEKGPALPEADIKTLRIALPPGAIAMPDAVPRCSRADFARIACPAASVVGEVELDVFGAEGAEPYRVYNLEPSPGRAAALGFHALRAFGVITEVRVSPQPPHNLVVQMDNVSEAAPLLGARLTIRGVSDGVPFLTLPRSCGVGRAVFEADSWQEPGAWVSAEPQLQPAFDGCGEVGFSPALFVGPTTSLAASASGLDLRLDLPNDGLVAAEGIADADLAAATVELPRGMPLNPAAADGLGACAPEELAREQPGSAPGAGCPERAKIGAAVVTTPLLKNPVRGDIYSATPDDPATEAPGAENPFDARYALYLVLREPLRGILITAPIRVEADPADGRVTASIEDLPQLPISRVDLRFNSGPRAPLLTPPCGGHAIAYRLIPSSGAPATAGTARVKIDRECGAPAFAPELSAGTVSNAGGRTSTLVVDLRTDRAEPSPAALELTLPRGLAADFTAASVCPEEAAAAGACPAASRIGHARIALGGGQVPLWIPDAARADAPVFLGGSFRDAPYSLLVEVPARAGPFDLGAVSLRAPIEIDPEAARATVRFDGLPRILGGVPLRYRVLRLILDRPGFVRNPTSCEPAAISGAATSVDGERAPLQTRFQAAGCAALPFRPRLALRFSGALRRNGHPTLRAVLSSRRGDAGIRDASFALPPGQLLDFRRLRALCPRGAASEHCPRDSRLGHVRLESPFLEGPLTGPIHLREPSGGMPDLVAALSSGPLRVHLRGRTASDRGRLRVLFRDLPDVPISRAVITLAGGRRGLLVNTESLCPTPRRARVSFLAHNGSRRALRPRIRLRGRC